MRPGTHLIWSFGGHFTLLSRFKSGRLEVAAVSVLIITWESALFSFQLCVFFRPAAATPGYVVILFYPGRRETCHEKPWGKSKVHYLIVAARNASVSPVRYRVMEETRVEKRNRKAREKTTFRRRFVANRWMKSWEEEASLGRRTAMAGWVNLSLLSALWATAVSRLCGADHCANGGVVHSGKTGTLSISPVTPSLITTFSLKYIILSNNSLGFR